MKRYQVREVKVDETAGGMACGPMPGSIIVGMRIFDGEKEQWLTSSTMDVYCKVLLTDDDVFDIMVEEDFSNEEFWNNLDDYSVADFEVGEFANDDIPSGIEGIPENQAALLLAYMVLVTYADEYEQENLIEDMEGEYIDDMTTYIVNHLVQYKFR